MDKLSARSLDAEGLSDGQYVVDVVAGKVAGWVAVPPSGVESVTEGARIGVDNTDPANPVVSLKTEQYLLSFVVWDGTDWVSEIVADGGSHELMYLEVPIP